MKPMDLCPDRLQHMTTSLLEWYRANKRDLPWRRERDPYLIWISEIMLQQTQVATAIPHYQRFIRRFPTLDDLAEADIDEVLHAWEGLGYYSRARNLHSAVREVQTKYGGRVPSEMEQLRALKGIGEYTAGAIASIAFNRSVPAVDGNVLRVITRLFAIADDIGLPKTKRQVSSIVTQMIPEGKACDFTQALMELGALICSPTGAECERCPLLKHCQAFAEGIVSSLPINQKRTPVKIETMMVVIWQHEGRYAVERRPDQGLLARQWQLPMLPMGGHDVDKAIKTFMLAHSQGDQSDYRTLGTYQHQFSHIRWQLHVVALSTPPQSHSSFSWLIPSDLEQIHLITAHRQILRRLTAAMALE